MAYRLKYQLFTSILVISLTSLLPLSSFAAGELLQSTHLLAQNDEGTDAYDPFSDYSEFEEATEEEADINFFKNGRFFTIALVGGYRMFTDVLGKLYSPSFYFGGQVNYFFDLRFALQVVYITGNHQFNLVGNHGNVELTTTELDIKYYFNVQNVTRGLASLNPYIIIGASQNYRTLRLDGVDGYARDSAIGVTGGGGIEIPLMRNKMYFGAEAVYQYINFADKNSPIVVGTTVLNTYPRGDVIRFSGILGVNF